GVGHRARGDGQLRAALHVRDLRGVGVLTARRSHSLRAATTSARRAPLVSRPRLPMDTAALRGLRRCHRHQYDRGTAGALAARARHPGARPARLLRLAAGQRSDSSRVTGFKFPHPLVLLVAGLALAAAASWMLPTGQYERRDDPITGRRVVVP